MMNMNQECVVYVFLCLILARNVNGSRISFTASPSELKANLTGAAAMRCELSDNQIRRSTVTNTTDDVLHVTSILITMDDGTTQVAHASAFDAPEGLIDAGNLQVKGEVTGSKSEGYLQLTWRTPSLMRVGEYACEVHTLDKHHQVIVFRSTLEMTREAPSIADVVAMLQTQHHIMEDAIARQDARISAQEAKITSQDAKISQLEAANSQQEVRISAQIAEISDLQVKLQNKSQLITQLQNCSESRSAFMVVMDRELSFDNKQPLIYDKVLLDTDNGYNNNTGAFVCKTPGIYYFSVSSANYNSNNCIQLHVNSNVVTSTISFDSSTYESASLSATVALKAGDKVQVIKHCSSSAFFSNNDIRFANAFTGHLLHADACLG